VIHNCFHCSFFASQEIGWVETQRQKGFPLEQPLIDDTNWGTAATAGTTSMVHIDDEGFATVITVLTESKYWVVMRPRPGVPDGEISDQGSIYAYPPGWSHGHTGSGIFMAEGIHLTAGDVL
jgi:hypothetical protein